MEKWHPSKITIIVSLLAILISVLGSTITTGVIFGKALNRIDVAYDLIARAAAEIRELRAQDAISAQDRAALNANWKIMYDMLGRLEQQAISNGKLSKDTNDRIKKTW